MTYKDAEATFHEAEQIQAHLQTQDDALNTLLDKLAKLEEAIGTRGDPTSRIVLVAEAPGATEVDQGRPFVGRAGDLLWRPWPRSACRMPTSLATS